MALSAEQTALKGSSLNIIQHSSDSHFTSYSLFLQFNQLLVQSLASSVKEKRKMILVQSINLYYFIISVIIILQLFFTLMNMFAFSKDVYVFYKIYGVKMNPQWHLCRQKPALADTSRKTSALSDHRWYLLAADHPLISSFRVGCHVMCVIK